MFKNPTLVSSQPALVLRAVENPKAKRTMQRWALAKQYQFRIQSSSTEHVGLFQNEHLTVFQGPSSVAFMNVCVTDTRTVVIRAETCTDGVVNILTTLSAAGDIAGTDGLRIRLLCVVGVAGIFEVLGGCARSFLFFPFGFLRWVEMQTIKIQCR